jgi:hypothetical protein
MDGNGSSRTPRVKTALHAAATLVITYMVLTTAGFIDGDRWLAAGMPLLAKEVDWLLPAEFTREAIGFTTANGQGQIALEAVTTTDLHAPGRTIAAGALLRSTTLKGYALQHAAIVFAILAAWPAGSLRRRALLVALGVPCALLSVSLDIPFVLTGLLRESWLQQVSPSLVATDPLVVYYSFLHRGGRIGLSIVLAIAAATTVSDPLRALAPRAAEPAGA